MAKHKSLIALHSIHNDEAKSCVVIRTEALFDNTRAFDSFKDAFEKKHPDHEVESSMVDVDPILDTSKMTKATLLATKSIVAKGTDELVACGPTIVCAFHVVLDIPELELSYDIAVAAFSNRKSAKAFQDAWSKDDELREIPLVERNPKINPSRP